MDLYLLNLLKSSLKYMQQVFKNMKIFRYTKLKDIVPVATSKMLVTTCGDWRQGWTTLL